MVSPPGDSGNVHGVERDVPGACPLDCPDGCSWIVTVRDGEAVRLRGTPDHPFTRGALCNKVSRYLDHTLAPDRLLHPLRRVGAKGEGRFARISWDEALGEMAQRLLAIRDEHGGEAIWPFQGTGTLGYLQGLEGRAGARLWNVLGASDHAATICSAAGTSGLRRTLGTNATIDPEGFAHARLILLWGSNPLSSHHHFWKFVLAARAQGAHVAVIDPVRTRTAAQADEHLAPLPGTDAALALALMHVVVRDGAHDEAFLRERCEGWEPFRERIAAYPPERAAAICDLPVERIEALGRRLATTRPTAIRATMGIQRHAGGGMTLRTLASNPDTARARAALAREDLFTVVIEQVPTDTTDYADLVLPSTMQTEHLDVHDGYGHLYLAWNEPAVEPPGECLPHTEIFRRLARAMGLREPALYDDDLTLARALLDS